MHVLANFLVGLARVIDVGLTLYYWLIVIRALISWVNPDPFNPIVRFLHRATDPVLDPIRKILPQGFGIDISPIIAFFVIILVKMLLIRALVFLASKLV
ncbi:MAG: YggT family protein [Candidatus Omnitrophica bacterium]|nr:YggT family protein [Candidatus Omnitrophota bacterium]